MEALTLSTNLPLGRPEHVIHDALRNVHARGADAVAEFHGVVHFVDEKTIVGLEEIDRHDPTPYASGRVGDPVLRESVDGGDTVVADDEAPDIAPFFFNVLLYVEDGMVIGAQGDFVLENGLCGISVVDLR